MTGGDGFEGGLAISKALDALKLRGLNPKRDTARGLAAFVMAGKPKPLVLAT